MINPESIPTEIVSAAVAHYRYLWPLSSECRCGKVPVCMACEWPAQAAQLQARINVSGLSIPVPTIDLGGKAPDVPKGNPLARKTALIADRRFKGELDGHARKFAQSVSVAGLPVFYLDLDESIRLTLAGHGQAIRDIALYAPALVYHHYYKEKASISRLHARLYSRQYGFCWLIQREGL